MRTLKYMEQVAGVLLAAPGAFGDAGNSRSRPMQHGQVLAEQPVWLSMLRQLPRVSVLIKPLLETIRGRPGLARLQGLQAFA